MLPLVLGSHVVVNDYSSTAMQQVHLSCATYAQQLLHALVSQ